MQAELEKDVKSNVQNGAEDAATTNAAKASSTPPSSILDAAKPPVAAVQDDLERHSTIDDTSTTTLSPPDASYTSFGTAANSISDPHSARAVMQHSSTDSKGQHSDLAIADAPSLVVDESSASLVEQEASSQAVTDPPLPLIDGHDQTAPSVPSESYIEQEWELKTIQYPPLAQYPSELKILVQDANGPCSFLALCNILILRGDIALPPDQNRASYSQLSSLVADFLLRRSSSTSLPPSPTLPINALDFALSILPKTLSGLDVNVDFINGGFSRPTDAQPGELELFALAGVPIKHGWLASPDEEETFSILKEHAKDYDAATAFVAEGDALANGAVTSSSSGMDTSDLTEHLSSLTLEEQTKVQQASLVHRFLQSSSTQLTYAGLFSLSETLSPGTLCALFRNAHFSVLFRHPCAATSSAGTGALFTLVTDSALLHSRDCVWESLADTDGAASAFFDSDLKPARMRQDWVPRDTAQTRREEERNEDADTALAMQMQQDEYDREEYHRQRDQQRSTREQNERNEDRLRQQQQQQSPSSHQQQTEVVQPLKSATTKVSPASSSNPGKAKKAKSQKKECIVS